MRIVIIGAGEVGFHLASALHGDGHDIIMVDEDANRLEHASTHLDVGVVRGDALSCAVLQEAKVQQADILIALTSVESVNITAAIFGKRLGAERTIARLRNTEFFQGKTDLKTMGIDEVIIPELLAAVEIKALLKQSATTNTFAFSGGALVLVGISLKESQKIHHKTMNEIVDISKDNMFTTVAILRAGKSIIPRGNTPIQPQDYAYFIAPPEGIDSICTLANKKNIAIKSVTILGGGRMSVNTIGALEKSNYHIRLIEMDRVKAEVLAEQFPEIMVVNGDGRDVDLLLGDGTQQSDAFLALTGDSETNIISSLVAKSRGVKKTIALVENIDYIHLSQSIGVDTLINKKLIAANFISRYLRKERVLNLTSIHGVDADVLEFQIKEENKIVGRPVSSLGFPQAAIIGGVIRDKIGYAVRGDFQLRPHDRVVVLCQREATRAVEKFFL